MSEHYGRDYDAWVRGMGWKPGKDGDFQSMPEHTIILACDQYGDTVVVLTPTGETCYLTSDGHRGEMTDLVDGKNGWEHLHEMVDSGLMQFG